MSARHEQAWSAKKRVLVGFLVRSSLAAHSPISRPQSFLYSLNERARVLARRGPAMQARCSRHASDSINDSLYLHAIVPFTLMLSLFHHDAIPSRVFP